MKHMARLFSVLLLLTTSCSIEFNPPPLSLTAPAPEATNTPTVLLATPTFTAVPPTASLPAPTATLVPVTATQMPPTVPPATATNTQAPATATATNLALSVEQLRNATLTLVGSDQIVRTISLKDGKYQNGMDPAQAGYVSITIGEKIAFGDLNGDGVEDAAISIAENYGGSGVFVSVVAVLNQGGQPNAVATALIDDRPMMNELSIKNGELFVDATIHGPGDAMCCPGLPSKRFYHLIDNALVLSQFSTQTSNNIERVIQVDSPANGTEISGPFVIKGSVSISPFENTLGYKVYIQGTKDPEEQASFVINGDGLGGPGTFELALDLTKLNFSGAVKIEIADVNAADGSYLAEKTVFLVLK